MKRFLRSDSFLLFLAALAPRLALAIAAFSMPIALDDMYQYDMLGRSLAAGEGYRWYTRADAEFLQPYLAQMVDLSRLTFPENGILTTFRAPGYPFFLALVYLLVPVGVRYGVVRVLQALIFALMAPLTASLARLLGFGRKAGLLAGLGIAFYPILLFYPVALVSENLYIPLGLLAVILLLQAQTSAGWKWALAAGLTLGYTILTRSLYAPFTLLAAGWLAAFSRQQGWQKQVLKAGVLLAGAAALCLPWAVRNSLINGKPSFIENNLGYSLFIGYHPEGDGTFLSAVAIRPLAILDDNERDRVCMAQALEFIQADPGGAAWRVLRRLAALLGPEDREFKFFYSNGFLGQVRQPGLFLIYLLLVIPWFSTAFFAVGGLWLAGRRDGTWLALALFAGAALPTVLIMAEPRFHLGLVPVLLPFAASGWLRRSEWLGRLRQPAAWRRVSTWLAAAALLGLLALWVWGFIYNGQTLAALLGPDGYKLHLSY